MANLRAFFLLFARKQARRAFFAVAPILSFCFLVVRAAADEASTPMSPPSLSMCMGMCAAIASLVKASAALDAGTTTLLSEMSSLSSSVHHLKSLAHLIAFLQSSLCESALMMLEMSSTCT